jgi:hypothetical protein
LKEKGFIMLMDEKTKENICKHMILSCLSYVDSYSLSNYPTEIKEKEFNEIVNRYQNNREIL